MATKKKVAETSEMTGDQPISVKSLMEAGAHFGHQTHRWNPKMAPYIYGDRNGIHIINLEITIEQWKKARNAIVEMTSRGGNVLFVGTKRQARDVIGEEAERCGAFYVTTRWLGGALTNFQTIKNSIDRMKKMEDLLAKAEVADTQVKLNKKEKLVLKRELSKLNDALGGIRDMKRLPDLIFVVDVCKEAIAISEAWRLKIPVVALIDTNAAPGNIEYPIASNDDATRTIRLFARNIANAITEGRAVFRSRMGDRLEPQNAENRKHASNGHNSGEDEASQVSASSAV